MCLRGFRTKQTRLYSHRRYLETSKFGFRKNMDCTIYVAKTKVSGYHAADLRLCFRIRKKWAFS